MPGLYKTWKKKYTWDALISVLIFCLPLFVYFHLLFNEDYNAISIFGFTYETVYADVRTFIWYVLSKIIPIVLLTIWFLTCPYWWRYFVFVPLSLFLFTLLKYGFVYPEIITIYFALFILSNVFVFILIWLADICLFKELREFEFNNSFKYLLKDKILFYRVSEELKTDKQRIKSTSYKRSGRIILLAERLRKSLIDYQEHPKELKMSFRFIDLCLILILLLIPIIYNAFEYIPEGKLEYEWMGTIITSHGFKDVNIFVWYVLSKLCILIPLLIWFGTSQNWWRYAILSPIVIYTYQIWEGVKTSKTQADEIEFFKALPILLSIIVVLLIFSHFIKYRSRLAMLYDELINEVEFLVTKMSNSRIKADIRKTLLENLLQKTNNSTNAIQRIKDLQNLRKELIKEINSGS